MWSRSKHRALRVLLGQEDMVQALKHTRGDLTLPLGLERRAGEDRPSFHCRSRTTSVGPEPPVSIRAAGVSLAFSKAS